MAKPATEKATSAEKSVVPDVSGVVCRTISSSFRKAPRKLTSTQLSAFRSKKGPYAGNTSGFFYAAYVYFEKVRIKEGKPKSRKREEIESIYEVEGGLETGRVINRVYCLADQKPYFDSCGR